MKLAEWKVLSSSEQKEALLKFDALNGEGYDLAAEVAEDYKSRCKWPYEKFNILNRFGELCICVCLSNEDYQIAYKYPEANYLGFRVFYGKESNYIQQ